MSPTYKRGFRAVEPVTYLFSAGFEIEAGRSTTPSSPPAVGVDPDAAGRKAWLRRVRPEAEAGRGQSSSQRRGQREIGSECFVDGGRRCRRRRVGFQAEGGDTQHRNPDGSLLFLRRPRQRRTNRLHDLE